MNSLIPLTREDISEELIENLLRPKFPDITVRSIEIQGEVLGTAAKLCLKVDHAGAAGLPRRIWLKTAFPAPHLDRALSISIYAKEAKFYSELQPLVGGRVPNCYGAVYDDPSGRGVVLLEDLDRSDIKFPGIVNPLSVGQVASGLELLADLHSRSWEQNWLYRHGVGTFISPGSTLEKYLRDFTVPYIQSFLDGPVGEVVPPGLRNAQRIYDALWRVQPFYQRGPYCLLHGDPHPGNTYLVDGSEVGMLDWQAYVRGPWAHDVSYWLVGGLAVDDRRQFEHDLLENYLGRMKRNGVKQIGPGEAWDNYRRFIAYGFWVWVRCPPAQQPIEHNIALAERFGAAMADHRVFEMLGI